MAKVLTELSAVVDAGTPLIKSCHNCKSKQLVVFIVGDVVQEMNKKHGLGQQNYSHFDELDRQSNVAAEIMEKEVALLSKDVQDAKVM